jgi:outer membrane protein
MAYGVRMKKITNPLTTTLYVALASIMGLSVVTSNVLASQAFINTAQTPSIAKAVGLLDVYQLAVLHDATLAQARAQFEADQKLVSTARASLLPQVKADASYFMTDSSLDSSVVNTRDDSVTLNQALYQHDSWARYEKAKFGFDAAQTTLQNAEQTLILTVAERYFAVLLANENLILAHTKETADKTQLERAEASAEVGLASKTEVLQAKSSYDLSRSDRINAENQVDESRENLMKLTGQALTELKKLPVLAASTILFSAPYRLDTIEALAEQDNLNVKLASANVSSAQQEIEVQKGGYWPTVGLQAKYSDTAFSDYSATSINTRDRNSASVGVTVSVPLYSGGRTDSQVSAARSLANASQQALRNAREQARIDARVQLRNLQRGGDLVAALREAVNSNDAFLEAAEEGYKVGLQTLLDVLTARTNQYNARKNLIEATHAQVLTRLKLESTLGSLTSEDLIAFDGLLSQAPVFAR